ncbi:YegP family protein [Allomuricauda sp. d1]|uniref:YegP family protein n=1 Tax=Allomuricauda sp. d1 TaxID=3136725 RepID=UPI0031DEEFE3
MVEIKSYHDKFRFEITSLAGAVLLKSVAFSDEEEARTAFSEIQQFRNKKIVRFERRTDHDGQFFFQMKNATGKVLAESQTYDSEPGMENGIKNLKKRLSELST